MADTCASLAAEIAALKAEIGRIKSLSEAQVRVIVQSVIDGAKPGIITSTKSALEPGIATAIAGGIAVVFDRLSPNIKNAENIAKTATATSDKALAESLAQAKARIASEEILRTEINRVKGIAHSAKAEAVSAIGNAAKASKDALNAATQVTGIKGAVNGIGGKIDDFGRAIGKLEVAVGGAITKAAEAVGISKGALAATGRLAGQVLQIFNVIGTIFTILDGMATREVLGARIDALENLALSIGNDVSKILGKLLGLQNQIRRNEASISEVRIIAIDAKGIGEAANLKAGAAQVTASRAERYAITAQATGRQAQVTADGAVRNANRANENAKIAYQKAVESTATANNATTIANIANSRAERAIGEIKAVQGRVLELSKTAQSAITKAEIALGSASAANNKAEKAISVATRATDEAKSAIATAKDAITKAEIARLAVGTLSSKVSGIEAEVDALAYAIPLVGNLANTANSTANTALNEARNKGASDSSNLQQQLDDKFNNFVAENNKALNIQGFKQSDLAKQFDGKLIDFNRQNNLTSEQRFNQFKRENEQSLGIIGFNQSNLAKQFDAKFKDFQRQSNLTSNQRFEEFQQTNKQSLGLIQKDLIGAKNDIQLDKAQIKKIDTKLGEQEKVNDQALPKLDQIAFALALIPSRAAAAIRPDIPTIPQIETASATGTCRTTQPGGCMNKALADNAANINNNINNNTNNKVGNILDALNTGANAALLAGQKTILERLGAQLPGGIGGKLSRFADWMHLDRVLNIMILAASVHNALMLSNDIGQTLIGAINNVLQFIGLKKEDGSGFDIGSAISGSIESLIKGAIGADNYVELKAGWAKANRIYQATTNIFNSFQGLASSILNANEMLGAMTGKIGNALRKSGTVLEKSYEWFNPQPKYNRITQSLEALQQGASTIQQVTQVPLDIIAQTTELTTASTEFIKAIKEDNKPINKGIGSPEPDKIKADELAAKTASVTGFDLLEIFFEEDE
ncbi:hypothetical protein FM036_45635 [Nostoc sp. HG1]|nr:hypothetical protein [Nostoc sp. HG1]